MGLRPSFSISESLSFYHPQMVSHVRYFRNTALMFELSKTNDIMWNIPFYGIKFCQPHDNFQYSWFHKDISHCPKNAEAITPIKYSVVFFPPGKISGRPYFTNVTTADLCPWGKIYAIWYRMKTHYCDVIISVVASQITCVSSVCSTVCSGADKELRVTGLCAGNSPVTGEFPSQRDSHTENVSIW